MKEKSDVKMKKFKLFQEKAYKIKIKRKKMKMKFLEKIEKNY